MSAVGSTIEPELNWDGTVKKDPIPPRFSYFTTKPLKRYPSWKLVEPDFEATFADLYSEAFGVLLERQAKYGPNNIAQQGLYGVVKRIVDDKAQRIARAINGTIHNGQAIVEVSPGEEGDTFEDGLLDLANYALIALALRRGLWGRELTDKSARLELKR